MKITWGGMDEAKKKGQERRPRLELAQPDTGLTAWLYSCLRPYRLSSPTDISLTGAAPNVSKRNTEALQNHTHT